MTFFSFSKTNHNPCKKDGQVYFSPLFSIFNIIISTISLAGVLTKISLNPYFNGFNGFIFVALSSCLVLHFLGIVFTLMVIYYDKICCCRGECCLGAEERMVYDPSQPEKILLWKDGKVLICSY